MTTTPTTTTEESIFALNQHTNEIKRKLNSFSDDPTSSSTQSSGSRFHNSTAYCKKNNKFYLKYLGCANAIELKLLLVPKFKV